MEPKSGRPRALVVLVSLICVTVVAIRMNGPSKFPTATQVPAVPAVRSETEFRMPVEKDARVATAYTGAAKPLPVGVKTELHEWTAADARDLSVIEMIAHNPDEALRMLEENERIERRQLVYRKETVPMLIQRSINSGQPLKSFTLPGLDGQEVEVEVTEVHLAGDQQGGAVMGRVKGRFNSMVSVGFSNGCESFNVISPDDQLFLTADAREPGEVIVKEIDPNQYASAPCAGPILTENLPPPHPKMAVPEKSASKIFNR